MNHINLYEAHKKQLPYERFLTTDTILHNVNPSEAADIIKSMNVELPTIVPGIYLTGKSKNWKLLMIINGKKPNHWDMITIEGTQITPGKNNGPETPDVMRGFMLLRLQHTCPPYVFLQKVGLLHMFEATKE
jgi:hypothetical protein